MGELRDFDQTLQNRQRRCRAVAYRMHGVGSILSPGGSSVALTLDEQRDRVHRPSEPSAKDQSGTRDMSTQMFACCNESDRQRTCRMCICPVERRRHSRIYAEFMVSNAACTCRNMPISPQSRPPGPPTCRTGCHQKCRHRFSRLLATVNPIWIPSLFCCYRALVPVRRPALRHAVHLIGQVHRTNACTPEDNLARPQ